MNEKPAYTDLNAQVIGGWIENGSESEKSKKGGTGRLC